MDVRQAACLPDGEYRYDYLEYEEHQVHQAYISIETKIIEAVDKYRDKKRLFEVLFCSSAVVIGLGMFCKSVIVSHIYSIYYMTGYT